MKVVSTVAAQAFQVFRQFGSLGYLPDAVQKVVEHYHFVDFPREPFQLFPSDTSQPVAFHHGKVEIDGRMVIIDWLNLYSAALQIVTHTNTSDALAVVEHISEWATKEFGIELERMRGPGFWSQINVRFEKPLPLLLPEFGPISAEIDAAHPDFLNFRPKFQLAALHFNYEPEGKIDPVAFRIERVSNPGFDDDLYLSDAPLTTGDHIKILTDFEAVCLRKSAEA